MKTLDGKPYNFSSLAGKKVLLFNTASQCGYTPQLTQLEELHKKYHPALVVIGIPSNDFGAQEPGTPEEIQDFCQTKYGVTFTLLEKTVTKGPGAHPLFIWLSDIKQNGVNATQPQWNFGKYLLDEKGELVRYFAPIVSPLDEDLIRLI